MKKAFLFFVLLFALKSSFAQTIPSKEDIINWIASKINEQGSSRQQFNGGKFFYKYYKDASQIGFSMSDNDGTNGFPKNQNIYFDNICSAVRLTEKDVTVAIKIKLKRPITRDYNDGSGAEIRDYVYLYMDWILEPNLLDRMIKAFNDLGSYNCPPVKEVY